jgi:hypothetical protein
VDPDAASVQVHVLDQGRCVANAYAIIDPEDKLAKHTQDRIPVSVLSGLEINLKTAFSPRDTGVN